MANLCGLYLIAECPVSLQMAQRTIQSTGEHDWNELCRNDAENSDETGITSYKSGLLMASTDAVS